MALLSKEEQERIFNEAMSEDVKTTPAPDMEHLRILVDAGMASEEEQARYHEAQATNVDYEAMAKRQYGPGSPIGSQAGSLKREAQHLGYGILDVIPSTFEGIPKLVGGAVDELLSHTGLYGEDKGYHIRDWIDAHMLLDEQFRSAYEPEGGVLSGGEAGAQAFGRGATSGISFLGSGQKVAGELSKETQMLTSQLTAARSAQARGAATAGMTAGGTAGAAIGFEMAPPGAPLEQRQQQAATGELIGSLQSLVTAPILPKAAKTAVKVIEKTPVVGPALAKARETMAIGGEAVSSIFGREDFWSLPLKEKYNVIKNWKDYVDLQHLSPQIRNDIVGRLDALVKAVDPEELQGRLRTFEYLQSLDPDFNPGMGAVLGTTEARALQQMFESRSPAFAQDTYSKTLKAIANIRQKLAKTPEYTHGKNLELLLETAQDEATMKMANLEVDMDENVQRLLQSHFDPEFIPADEASRLRENLQVINTVYKETKDTLYELAKPTNTKDFLVESNGLIAHIKSLRDKTNPFNISEKQDPYLGGTLQKLVDEWENKAGRNVGEVIGTNALRKPGGTDVILNYDDLRNLEVRLGDEMTSLIDLNPHSRQIGVYNSLLGEVRGLIDSGYQKYFKEGIKLRDTANDFFANSFVPRLRDSVTGEALRKEGQQFKITDDALMGKFWYQGDATEGARTFKNTFRNAIDPERGDFTMSEMKLMENEAKAAEDSLRRYATSTLSNAFRGANLLEIDPNEVLRQWKHDYRGVLKEYPEIAKKFSTTEDALAAIAEQRNVISQQRDAVNRSLIKKLTGMDANDAVSLLVRSDVNARKFLDEIDNVFSTKPTHAMELKKSLSDVIMNNILERSLNKKTGEYEFGRVAELLSDQRRVLSRLLAPEDLKNINSFVHGLEILKNRPALNVNVNINELDQMFKNLGITPASMLTRWYSLEIGKASPIWAASDTATRFILKKMDKHYTEVFKELMFSPESIKIVDDMAKGIFKMPDAKITDEMITGVGGKTHVYPYAVILANLGIKADRGISEWEPTEDTVEETDMNSSTEATAIEAQTQQQNPSVEEPEVLSPVMDNGKQRLTPEGRPVYENQWGDQVTERTVGVNIAGKEYNIPTVYEGKFVSIDEAVDRLDKRDGKIFDPITGRELQGYDTPEEADKAAKERSPTLYTEPQAINDPVEATKAAFDQAGVDSETGLIFAQIESSLKPEASAGTTSAAGLFQFTDDTWDQSVERYGEKYGITAENSDKFNPFQSAAMGAEYLKENKRSLEKQGHTADAYNLYAAHFLGATGANKFLKALADTPKAMISSVVGDKAVKANPGIFRIKNGNKWGRERNLQEVMDVIRQKVDKARKNIQGYLNNNTNDNLG